MSGTLNDLDRCLFFGLGGLVNIIDERLNQSIPTSKLQFSVLDIHCNRLVEIVESYRLLATDKGNGGKAELTDVDTWLEFGISGLLRIFERRISAYPEIEFKFQKLEQLDREITVLTEVMMKRKSRRG